MSAAERSVSLAASHTGAEAGILGRHWTTQSDESAFEMRLSSRRISCTYFLHIVSGILSQPHLFSYLHGTVARLSKAQLLSVCVCELF